MEVESIGVRGRTRRPVLDFRPTVGVIVAACAVPATYAAPRWQVASRRVISPRGFYGSASMMGAVVVVRNAQSGPAPGFRGCAPMMGGAVVVRNAESSQVGSGQA